MDSQHHSSTPEHLFTNQTVTRSASRTFLANVFAYMFLALGITAVVAFLFSQNTDWLVPIAQNKLLTYTVMFAPLVFVLIMSFGFKKLSAPAMMVIFLLYSAVNGITFSFVLLAYTGKSVFACFASAAAMFGVMAFMGYTTKTEESNYVLLLKYFNNRQSCFSRTVVLLRYAIIL